MTCLAKNKMHSQPFKMFSNQTHHDTLTIIIYNILIFEQHIEKFQKS